VFKPVSPKVDFVQLEEEVLHFWKTRQIFQKSMEQRRDAPRYVFYEGPPTANGVPGAHHVLARVFKDLFPRYHTMKGKYSLRKGGWDTHGLPVELEVEKELGFSGKKAIEEYGIAQFNQKCRESVFRYLEEWERVTERIGFWIDMADAYVTLKNEYIESVWWILRQLWERGLIYQGYKVVPYCPRCGTPLSDHEVALGYKEASDPSVWVKFPWRDEPGTYFLAWTTTPWTLPGNAALAVHPDVEYVMVELYAANGDKERFVLAKDLLEQTLSNTYRVAKIVKGKELVGTRYHPLYTFLPVEGDAWRVLPADFVSTAEGTGIVHIAPAFGGEDLALGQEHNLPVIMTVDPSGRFVEEVTPWRGLFVKDADPLIIDELKGRGLLYRSARYDHTYPFCWRCDTPLLYYARTTWYIETTRLKERLLAHNDVIHWYPDHIREGRFGNWLANNQDWALGRERYWGTPLPVWVCDKCGKQECVGSVQDLEQRTKRDLRDLDLHRPYVDAVTFACPDCGQTMRRVPEVIDCWFDSGAMSVAQWHYPFENVAKFEDQFPADFISEAVDQTRGWFYSLHAISTLLFDKPCFRNCVCLGHVLDGEGQKMSKSRGNVIDPWTVLDLHGADALRWYFYTVTPVGNSYRLSVDAVGDVVRKFMLTLWNTYAFFVTYANIDGWRPQRKAGEEGNKGNQGKSPNSLDRWILSELHMLVKKVDDGLTAYDATGSARAIQEFVDNLSNWYVRRSRRRFWKSVVDTDKDAAYATLYECLVTLSKLCAPFMPFLAETMYQNLVRSVDGRAPESVHLGDFPRADLRWVDDKLMADTRLLMHLASLGHGARNRGRIKVRQPLAEAVVVTRRAEEHASVEALAAQLADELNVKRLRLADDASAVADYALNLLPALLGPKYGARLSKLRAAVAAMPAKDVVAQLRAGHPVEVPVDGEKVALLPAEVEVKMVGKPGYAVAEEGGYLVAVATEITPALQREGLARELVRHIQDLRKQAALRIEETIVTYYQAEGLLAEVVREHAGYIKGETLSRDLVAAPPPAGASRAEVELPAGKVVFGLVRPG